MAVRVESLGRQEQEFDWNFAESQFQADYVRPTTQPDCYMRPATSEIYGRSLSTIQKLGIVAVDKLLPDAIKSPEADQARAEFYTSVEEGFGTDMELGSTMEVRNFDLSPVIDGKVMAKDLKTPISEMTAAGLICAMETAEKDSRFFPQLTRSKWDHENALLVDKMARGETDYNTRIVVSPFPEEAAALSGDAYWQGIGYVPHLKRGFVQLYHATKEGVICGSLSFDSSNRQHLIEVFSRYGIEIPDGEITDNWLRYAITKSLTSEQAKALALEIANEAGDRKYCKSTNTVEVTNDHRQIVDTVFNDSYIHACESQARRSQTPGLRRLIFQLADKAHHFNEHYKRSLYKMRANQNEFTDNDMVVVHELLVYSTIEMLRALHIRKTSIDNTLLAVDARYLSSLSPESFQNMLGGYGALGARNGRVYSACGLAISPGESGVLGAGDNPQYAFGGLDKLDRDPLAWAGGRVHVGKCVSCNETKVVGVKNWCKECISGHCGTKK